MPFTSFYRRRPPTSSNASFRASSTSPEEVCSLPSYVALTDYAKRLLPHVQNLPRRRKVPNCKAPLRKTMPKPGAAAHKKSLIVKLPAPKAKASSSRSGKSNPQERWLVALCSPGILAGGCTWAPDVYTLYQGWSPSKCRRRRGWLVLLPVFCIRNCRT